MLLLQVNSMDRACDVTEKTRELDMSFKAGLVSHIAVFNFRGSVQILPPAPNSSATGGDPLGGHFVNVKIVARAVSDDALGGILTEAALDGVEAGQGGSGVLTVTAQYDETAGGGSFSLWGCPLAEITVRLPNAAYGQDLPGGHQPRVISAPSPANAPPPR